jgi:hypothetical protein
MKISEDECDAVTWIDRAEAAKILSRSDLQSTFKLIELRENEWKETELPLSTLAGTEKKGQVESFALGTVFVFRKWLDRDNSV